MATKGYICQDDVDEKTIIDIDTDWTCCRKEGKLMNEKNIPVFFLENFKFHSKLVKYFSSVKSDEFFPV